MQGAATVQPGIGSHSGIYGKINLDDARCGPGRAMPDLGLLTSYFVAEWPMVASMNWTVRFSASRLASRVASGVAPMKL